MGYFGGTRHQPRLLGSGLIAMGLGTLLMSMAHFAAPPYQPEKGISLTCDTSSSKFSLLLLYIHFFYVCIHVYMVAYMYI